jgi:hypothetical protein
MDNGLIFPYPRRSVPDEPRCANHLPTMILSGRVGGGYEPCCANHLHQADLRASVVWLGPRQVVVKRWGDAGGQLIPAGGCAGASA